MDANEYYLATVFIFLIKLILLKLMSLLGWCSNSITPWWLKFSQSFSQVKSHDNYHDMIWLTTRDLYNIIININFKYLFYSCTKRPFTWSVSWKKNGLSSILFVVELCLFTTWKRHFEFQIRGLFQIGKKNSIVLTID